MDPIGGNEAFSFNIQIPKPFVLAEQDKGDLEKIREEIMDKVTTWERRMSKFFDIYFRGADSWRIKPFVGQGRKPKQLFNSKSGETHRAAETLATVWHRMLNASDPWFEAQKQGLNQMGLEVTEDEIYATEGVLLEQQQESQLKKKQLRTFRSLALMGAATVEMPYTSQPYGYGQKSIEYTDWVFRPMIRTGFDTSVYDINESDYIFTIDFISKWMLRNQASLDTEFWDQGAVEKHIKDFQKGGSLSASQVYGRLRESRSRAGYYDTDENIYETTSYHGRLDVDNSVIQAFAESVGLDNDPKFVDWSCNVLGGQDIAKFHMTQYGDWRTRFLNFSYKEFEDESIPYGIANIGRRLQREMDINESMTNDMLTFFTLMMMKIGKYSGYTEKQFVAEPLKLIELEDINQLAPLTPDPSAFRVALDMINLRREDFRNIVGAQTNLQAQLTKASATESAIAQTEAIRGAGVHAELIGEVLRKYLKICHLNNLNYMDEPIWVGLTGSKKPMLVDKNKLPANIGFLVKIVTDKDFRPERLQKLLEAIQVCTSIRNLVPSSINAVTPLFEEYFRSLGMNPRLLTQPRPMMDQMEQMAMRLTQQGGQAGNPPPGGAGLPPETQGEIAGAGSTGGNVQQTPVGPVLTSPVSADMSAGG